MCTATGRNIHENQNTIENMRKIDQLIEFLGEDTLIVTDKATIDAIFSDLPVPDTFGLYKVDTQPNLPNSRGISRGKKSVYFVDIDEVDIKLV